MAEESIEVKQEPFDEIIPLAATHRGDDVVNVVPSTGEIKEELSLEINNTTADGYVIYATEAFELSTESETRKRVSSSDPSKDFAAMQKKFKSTQQDSTEELRQWEAALKNDATINSTDAIMEYSDGSCHDISTLVSTEEGGETCHNDDDGYACDMRNSDESTPIITAPYTSDKQYESEFLNLLTKHKLKHYFAKLKDMNIGLDCLKAIREVDIKDMFGADIGARIRFRGLVDEWRATNMDFNTAFSNLIENDAKLDEPVTKRGIAELKSFINDAQNMILKEHKKSQILIKQVLEGCPAHANINQIPNQWKNATPHLTFNEILPETPYQTVLEFKQFEVLIRDTKESFENLVDELAAQTTINAVAFLKSSWRRIMTDNVARHFCWTGTLAKPAIRSLSVTAALKAAYRRKFASGSNEEFQRTIISFFQHAKTRLLKKQNYEKNKAANLLP